MLSIGMEEMILYIVATGKNESFEEDWTQERRLQHLRHEVTHILGK